MEYNVYCDESCHLLNDGIRAMVLGAVWCPKDKVKEINRKIRDIKLKNGFNPKAEVKWTKVSNGNIDLYKSLITFFFEESDLHFRAVVIPDKNVLDHTSYNQTHDDFYYKMYFVMLNQIWDPDSSYNVYLDIKDTQGYEKVKLLEHISRTKQYDYTGSMILKLQQIRSHESEVLQITDLLIGTLGYIHRSLETSNAKLELIRNVKSHLHDMNRSYSLLRSTYLKESKFNMLVWEPSFNNEGQPCL